MRRGRSMKRGAIFVNVTLIFICFIWLIPTVGLLVSSFRMPDDIQTSGWWTVLPHSDQATVSEMPIPEGLDKEGVMTIEGATGTFEDKAQLIYQRFAFKITQTATVQTLYKVDDTTALDDRTVSDNGVTQIVGRLGA